MRAPKTSRNCPRGGKAFSTRRAVIAVKITSPLKLAATNATTARSSVIIAADRSSPQSCSPARGGSRRTPLFIRALEFHSAVVHAGKTELQHVQRVILMQPPGPLRTLFRKHVFRPLNVAGAEIDGRLFGNRIIPLARRATRIATRVHVFQQTADVLRGQIRFQRPRSVRITERRRQIWHV